MLNRYSINHINVIAEVAWSKPEPRLVEQFWKKRRGGHPSSQSGTTFSFHCRENLLAEKETSVILSRALQPLSAPPLMTSYVPRESQRTSAWKSSISLTASNAGHQRRQSWPFLLRSTSVSKRSVTTGHGLHQNTATVQRSVTTAALQRSVTTATVQRSVTTAAVQEEPLTRCIQEGGIRTVILNNIKKRNALSLPMLESLREAITRDVNRQDLMVIVLRSSGPVFSAGHDLKELRTEAGIEYHKKVFERCMEVMKLVQDVPVPVIAEVRGLATAAGCQLVASCDIAIASENAKFATPGVNIGLFCNTPGIALARSIPKKAALLMLFTGQPISAQDALTHGLVSKVVPDDLLEDETMAIAKKIASNSRPVTALGKSFFYKQVAMDRDEAYRCGEEKMLENLRLPDSQEGINAFLQKRQPKWSHDSNRDK
ncbi:Enoyl-CoA hydratase domain-containing protein 3, mitochondrial [Lamellibrachia satsuma]|nr:Enoyl-CoA hydratase domain-containing protein 3, mitochondrial [Lamellibrachia satsuma]